MILPGWNSIDSTDYWSTFFFWISIGALVLLGLAEVASHFYTLRHDGLVAQQYQIDKYESDSDIARLHLETAKTAERAANAELALEKYREPRALTPEQKDEITAVVKTFSGTRFDMSLSANDPEMGDLANFVQDALMDGGWHLINLPITLAALTRPNPRMPGSQEIMWVVPARGVVVQVNPGEDKLLTAAEALATALAAKHIVAVVTRSAELHFTNPETIHVVIGFKP